MEKGELLKNKINTEDNQCIFLDSMQNKRDEHLNQTLIDSNPHLWQITTKFIPFQSFQTLPRILTSNSPQLPYRRRRGEKKSLVHWGQRKLLLSEIEFLLKYSTEHSNSPLTCLYCGAAPGTHIPYLSQLFPHVSFILIDPAPFSCSESENIQIRNEFMTDALAREYSTTTSSFTTSTTPTTSSSTTSTSSLLFISDIRSADWQVYGNQLLEQEIMKDMEDQMRWHSILSPIASMMKFRLPWTVGTTNYLAGDVYLPIWGPQTTTESRLIVKGMGRCDWDHQKYWEQMFYFNSVTRCSAYDHPIPIQTRIGKLITPTVPAEYLPNSTTPTTTRAEEEEEEEEEEWRHKHVNYDEEDDSGDQVSCDSVSCCVDYCYDCSCEILILQEYLKWKSQQQIFSRNEAIDNEDEDVSLQILSLIDQISVACLSIDRQPPRKGNKNKRVRKNVSERDLTSTCPTTIHTLDLLRACSTPFQDQTKQPLASTSSIWIQMEPPDMSDLPHNDRGENGYLGLGYNIPSDCALDIWLWRLLDSVTKQEMITELTLLDGNLDDLLLNSTQKLQIFQRIPSMLDSDPSDEKRMSVVAVFTTTGVTYLYHKISKDSSFVTCTRINLPPFSWPSFGSQIHHLNNLPVLFCGYLHHDFTLQWSLSLTHLLCYKGIIITPSSLVLSSSPSSSSTLRDSLLPALDYQNIPWKLSIFSLSGLQEIVLEGDLKMGV